MNWPLWRERLTGAGLGRRPVLTRSRIGAAYAVAVATDILQFALGPLGWVFSDEILDIIALIATTRLLGFHPLLLPTFIIEVIPIVDAIPTWTACVALVVTLRKRQQPPSSTADHPATIDIKPTSVT